jgi:PAS domain S-box-containing protein
MRLIPAVDRALREVVEQAEYQRAEEAMRQSEYKYREMFESLADAAFLVDQESRKIIDTNRSAQAALGCGRADILGRTETQFLVFNGGESDTEAQSPGPVQCLMQPTDGRAFPVELRTTHLTLYGRSLLLRLCRRLSEQGSL